MSFVNSVFISSTYDDLVVERNAVADALVSCGCLPVGMENFGANPINKLIHLKNSIHMCDLFVLILAGRYGSLIPSDIILDDFNISKSYQMSYTEYEFRQAKKYNKPIFIFRHRNYKVLPAEKRESNSDKMKYLEGFIERVELEGEYHAFFDNISELSQAVKTSFGNYGVKTNHESICNGVFVSFIPALRCYEETHPFKSDEWQFQANGSSIYGNVKRLMPATDEREWHFTGLTNDNEVHLSFSSKDPLKRAGSMLVKKSTKTEGLLEGSYYQFSKTLDGNTLLPTTISLRRVDDLRKKEYALLDWDNTLRDGFLLFDWIDFLCDKGFVEDSFTDEINAIKKKYAEKKITYRNFSDFSADKYAGLVVKISQLDMQSLIREFIRTDIGKFYNYSADLFKLLEENNIFTIIISGSPKILIDQYRSHFHIDEIYALEPEITNPFTNIGICNYGGNKMQIVKYIKTLFGGKTPLLAMGDSISDYPILDDAKHKFFVSLENEPTEKGYVLIRPDSKTVDIMTLFSNIFET